MSRLAIHLDVVAPGSPDVSDCVRDAVTLANEWNLPVRFAFNDVPVVVYPGDNPNKVCANWWRDRAATAPRPSPPDNPFGAFHFSGAPTMNVPVRIQRDGVWQAVDLDTLTDDELEAFCDLHGRDPMTGWEWARTLAKHLAGRP